MARGDIVLTLDADLQVHQRGDKRRGKRQQGGEPDVAKVLDFGLVKSIRDGEDPNLSGTGLIAGTPYYMAPETILAYQEIDAPAIMRGVAKVLAETATESVDVSRRLVEDAAGTSAPKINWQELADLPESM